MVDVETVLFPDLSFFDESADEQETLPDELSEWARLKIGTFQARLETVLQNRKSKGYKYQGITQVSTALLLRLVNESFGFNGWSSSVVECELLSQESDEDKKVFSAKRRAIICITLRDGTTIEAQGYGESLNQPHKAASMSNSLKMAITNGLRNGILQFPELLTLGTSIKVEEQLRIE